MDEVNLNAQKIIDACEDVFDGNSDDCNKFVKAVAEKFGIALTGNADAIVDGIQSDGWTSLLDGIEARAKADAGWLVVGGLKGGEQTPPAGHGHVVIIVSGPLAHDKYPTAYWGQLGSGGVKNKTVNYAWTQSDRDKVNYAARVTGS